MKIFNSVNIGEDICIDPGTDFISIYIAGQGVVLREPSVVAYNIYTKEIYAVGQEAADMEGRTPKTVATIRPIHGNGITDCELVGELLLRLLAKVKKSSVIKPRVMVSIPCGISDVEEKAIIKAAMRAGARQVIIVEAPIAAALGARCDITLARGLLLLDVGAGKTDIAAISVCNTVVSRTIKTAGNDFTADVIDYMYRKRSLEIGEKAARNLKEAIGTVQCRKDNTAEVCGMDISSRLPRKIRVSSAEIENIFDNRIATISNLIRDTLDSVPPEILGDILEDGILMVGGGAKLDGLADKLTEKSGIKIFTAEDAELCTIKGAGIAIENLDSLPNIVQSYHNL